MMEKLYGFEWDVGRMGDVHGMFVADEADIEKAMGQDVYFGEILGKHSEVRGVLEEDDLKILSENPDFVQQFKEIMPNGFGYNPLDYITYYCEECGEMLERDYPDESVVLPCWSCAEEE